VSPSHEDRSSHTAIDHNLKVFARDFLTIDTPRLLEIFAPDVTMSHFGLCSRMAQSAVEWRTKIIVHVSLVCNGPTKALLLLRGLFQDLLLLSYCIVIRDGLYFRSNGGGAIELQSNDKCYGLLAHALLQDFWPFARLAVIISRDFFQKST
jgi:hypothetical protein